MNAKVGLGKLLLAVYDALALARSRAVNIETIDSVCLTLGPYRNLTTLTASVLFLHRNCQVLNHGGMRIYGKRSVDFLEDFTSRKLDRFVQYAMTISEGGFRGNVGGSIVRSHAFDPGNPLREIYLESSSESSKERITCLYWKESLRTSNAIRARNVDLADILAADDRLRFLMPVRNPLDCAVSNVRTGHAQVFRQIDGEPCVTQVLDAILDEIIWFASLQAEFPTRFFSFFEHEISRSVLLELAKFLKLESDEVWASRGLTAMKIKPGYEHPESLRTYYRERVSATCDGFPKLSSDLLRFVE